MSDKRFRVAILDDFEKLADTVPAYEKLKTRADVTVLRERLDSPEKIERALKEMDALLLMRERTYFSDNEYSRLPSLKLISQTGRTTRHLDLPSATRHGIVIQHDLVAEGATFLNALTPYSVDQVAATLGELAKLHSQSWDSPKLADGWLQPEIWKVIEYRTAEDVQRLLNEDDRAGRLPDAIRDGQRLRDGVLAVAEQDDAALTLGPQGRDRLLHRLVERGLAAGPQTVDDALHLGAVGRGDHHRQVAEQGVRDEALGTVQHPAALGRRRSGRLHAGDIGARAGLGLGDAANLLAPDHRGQVAALVLLGRVLEEHVAHELAEELGVGHDGRPAGELLLGDAPTERVRARTAVLRRHGHPQDVELRHALIEIPRKLVRPVDLGGARPNLTLGELAAQVANLALGVGQIEVHGGGLPNSG